MDQIQIQNTETIISSLSKNSFKFMYVIGKGGFGKVWKVQYKKTKETYALKEMSKLKIIDKKSEKSINSEREFLSILNHPFIVNMHYAFQDRDNLYLVMDMLSGGDLRYHISRYRRFSEEQTRFFIACMVYTLEYIHGNNVIHRDIKPENLVLDNKGYVRITDFGIAKENLPDNSSETSGTPGYMSPEVMRGKNHSFPVDYFAIGVIGYEFMIGKRPYYGKNRKEIKEQMLSVQAYIKKDDLRQGWSPESADFINKLLVRKVDGRLGSKGGASEMKEHPWLKYYPWKELENKTLPAPFIPEKKDNFDKRYCESIDKISEETKLRYEEILVKESYNVCFKDFYYNKDEIEEKKKIENEKKKINDNNNNNNNNMDNNIKKEKDIKIVLPINSNSNIKNNNNNNEISKINNNNNSHQININSNRIPNSNKMKKENNQGTNRPSSSNKKRQLSHSNSSIGIIQNKKNNNNNQAQLIDMNSLDKPKIMNENNGNLFVKLNNNNNNLNYYNKNNSSVNIFNYMSHKNRLIQNFPQKNQKKNLINGLINGQHIRSSSVIDKKNRVKVSNNNHKININYPRAKNNSGNISKNIYGNKKLNRVNSASKMLSRSSTDLIFNKSNNVSFYNKNNFSNYHTNNHLNNVK
jgi:serine/threonine protein kinase